ncbi:helix-turn-helix domain-containing protein [Rubrimonas cliftonensis]|uniref:Helix-turn-helix domain-containing protein n=1 Tax=Rubrimonas cliftonensis TaxID=89524 RepID=A0A1H4FZ45_9RHOB|nr:helix-turn-helix domain-containing protein [Rubrimonas cliftonensis]SEB02351.1 Helix-turn-helix domain-containing protein [Rubrimonas cliftonensis]
MLTIRNSPSPQPQSAPPAPEGSSDAQSAVYAKFREAVVGGFQAVPDILLKQQDQLGLTPTDMLVLLNITMHWWYPQQKPFPRATTIARRMGVAQRTVQRSIRNLEQLGYLSREKDGKGRMVLDPEPLVQRLCELVKNDPDYAYRSRARDGGEPTGSNQPAPF